MVEPATYQHVTTVSRFSVSVKDWVSDLSDRGWGHIHRVFSRLLCDFGPGWNRWRAAILCPSRWRSQSWLSFSFLPETQREWMREKSWTQRQRNDVFAWGIKFPHSELLCDPTESSAIWQHFVQLQLSLMDSLSSSLNSWIWAPGCLAFQIFTSYSPLWFRLKSYNLFNYIFHNKLL